MKVLVTSGGTRIPIDQVRHIANMSRGTFGARIGLAGLLHHGWDLNFLAAKGSRTPFKLEIDLTTETPSLAIIRLAQQISYMPYLQNYREVTYQDFESYAFELANLLAAQPDIVILAAAVSDYGTTPILGKVRSGDGMSIPLHPLPKLISLVREQSPKATLVGFKLLVNSTDAQLVAAAYASLIKNRCDLVVANDLRDIKNSAHRLLLVRNDNGVPAVEICTQNLPETLAARITQLHEHLARTNR